MARLTRSGVGLVAFAVGCSACGGSDEPFSTPAPTPAPVSTAGPAPTTTEAATTTTTSALEPSDEGATATTATSSTTTSTSTTTTTTMPPAPPPPNDAFAGLRLGVERVAHVDLPTSIAWRSGDDAMYVTTQEGLVLRIEGENATPILDLSAETVPFEPGSERGLLGIAFDPRDGRMFLDYTDLANNTQIISFALDGVRADQASRRQVLTIEQPGLGHNGGRLLFDGDGNLYVGSGDGGGSNGRDAQDPTKLLGAILRIIPSPGGDGYTIPPDNPFADGVADRPEVIARGLRNPWTFSLDDETGDLWIGDVGNDRFEEINRLPQSELGRNFGWYYVEGDQQRYSTVPDGLVPPVYSYGRSEGVAVMGGHVYRGRDLPELSGAYIFGDLGGPIRAVGANGVSELDAERVNTLVGWGEDPSGELYLLSLSDGVYRLVRR